MAKFFDAVLRLSTDQFIKPLEDAGKHLNKFEKQYRDTGKTFWNSGKSMIASGEMLTKAVTLPLAAMAGASVKAYADAEQAVGGIETLFKDSADEVFKNAETAYKRAGVSAVKYMEQTTSFSATLLQGLEGDTVKAAKYADMAMVDMSDNANKFGTDLGMIQNAYQGFAKDNFTMLDNLKLGYGGTQAEMARLINDSGVLNGEMEATAENVKDIPYHVMIEGINQIQKELDVAGTTAKEAEETISGSFGMTKASLDDFLAGLGTKDADMDKLAKNLIDSAMTFGKNVGLALQTIWDNLPMPNWAKMFVGGLAAAGPLLIGFGKINKVIGKSFFKLYDFSKAIKKAGGVFQVFTSGPLGTTVKGLSNLHKNFNVASLLKSGISSIKAFSTSFIGGIKGIGPAIGGFLGKLKGIPLLLKSFSLKGMFTGILAGIKSFATIAAGAFGPIPILIGAIVLVIAALTGKFDWLRDKAEEIFPGIGVHFDSIREKAGVLGAKFMELVGVLTENLSPVFSQVVDAIMPLLGVFAEYALIVIDAFLGALGGLMDFLTGVFTGDWEKAWGGVVTIFENVFGGIKGIAKSIINGVISFLNLGIKGINKIKIPDWVPGVGGKGVNIPEIPLLYTGTQNWQGGLAEINDRGGEIVDLPKGSRVMPHDKSVSEAYNMGKSQRSGDTIFHIPKLADSVVFREEADMDLFLEKFARKVKIAKLNKIGANA